MPHASFPGVDGFLGTRASVMLDVVFLAMFAFIPAIAWSVYLVKVRKRFQLHKQVQLTLGLVLLAAVTLFEIDMRFISGWRERAMPSPFWGDGTLAASRVVQSLVVHLFFAVTTAVLWVLVIARALRNFPSPPTPGPHSTWHKRWGWIAAIDMFLTAATGWVFYWLAFAAK